MWVFFRRARSELASRRILLEAAGRGARARGVARGGWKMGGRRRRAAAAGAAWALAGTAGAAGGGLVPGVGRVGTRPADHPWKVQTTFLYYGELPSAAQLARLSAIYVDQTRAWLDWASSGLADVAIDVVYHRLGDSERKEDGTCRFVTPAQEMDGLGVSFPDVATLPDPVDNDTDIVYFQQLAETFDCANSCAAGGGQTVGGWKGAVVRCTGILPYIAGPRGDDPTEGASSSGGVSVGAKDISAKDCDATSKERLCDRVYVHELLHTLGLGYHQNGIRCSSEEISSFGASSTESWRDCDSKEYKNLFDVLGSARLSQGMAAKSRYDLGWMSYPADIELVTEEGLRGAGGEAEYALSPLDSADRLGESRPRALVISFTSASIGQIWLEYRPGNFFDSAIATTAGDGFNSKGVLALQWGTQVIDMHPVDDFISGEDWKEPKGLPGSESDYERASLNIGEEWFDVSTGLKLKTLSVSDTEARVKVEFGAKPECQRNKPVIYENMFGNFYFHLAKGDLEQYKGYGVDSLTTWILEYMPYWGKPEENTYKALFSYKTFVKNSDSSACPDMKEPFTIVAEPLTLPDGWRLDEGACMNTIAPQGTASICFTVAIPPGTPDGPYEILIRVERENGSHALAQASEWYPLWVCVGAYNGRFQSMDHGKVTPWECTVDGAPKIPARVPRPGEEDSFDPPIAARPPASLPPPPLSVESPPPMPPMPASPPPPLPPPPADTGASDDDRTVFSLSGSSVSDGLDSGEKALFLSALAAEAGVQSDALKVTSVTYKIESAFKVSGVDAGSEEERASQAERGMLRSFIAAQIEVPVAWLELLGPTPGRRMLMGADQSVNISYRVTLIDCTAGSLMAAERSQGQCAGNDSRVGEVTRAMETKVGEASFIEALQAAAEADGVNRYATATGATAVGPVRVQAEVDVSPANKMAQEALMSYTSGSMDLQNALAAENLAVVEIQVSNVSKGSQTPVASSSKGAETASSERGGIGSAAIGGIVAAAVLLLAAGATPFIWKRYKSVDEEEGEDTEDAEKPSEDRPVDATGDIITRV